MVLCTALGILTTAVRFTQCFAYPRPLTVVSLFAVLVIITALANFTLARAIFTVPSLRTVVVVIAGTLIVRAAAPIIIAVISALAMIVRIATSLWVKRRKKAAIGESLFTIFASLA